MAGKRYAILIASSKYPDEPGLHELRCPENDVDALNEVLRSPDFGQFTETFVFKNAPSHEVLEQIETVLHDAGREDLVLIYFSGHGKLNPSGQLCLATANTKLRTLGSTSIPVERIKSFFDAADTRQRILILDCCYSGAAGKDFVKGGVDDQLQLMSGGQGTFIMTASTGIQVAVEKEGDSLGLFTKHLVEGIRSGEADRNEDGFVDIHELYQHVYEKVRAEGAQEPMKWDINAKGRMILAKSGTESREKRTQAARKTLYELAAQERLTDGIVLEAAQLLSIPKREMTEKDQKCFLLIEQLHGKKISPPLFMEQWLRTCFAHHAAPKPKKDTTIGQYIDHGDGTITDTKTGLMWKRCPEGVSGVNGEEGKVEKYTWEEALRKFNVAYAGYKDWRLPTIDELKTLVYCSKGIADKESGRCNQGSDNPTINQQAFPYTPATWFWSRPPSADSSDKAWAVCFSYGLSGNHFREARLAVRLVRGGQ